MVREKRDIPEVKYLGEEWLFMVREMKDINLIKIDEN
jgi:hypothetical protein